MAGAEQSPKRRSVRWELLADTAIDVLAQAGGRGLTHRAVDRAAQVPIGTTKNYFPTRDALLAAAARRMAQQHSEAVQMLRDTTPVGVTADHVGELYAALLQRSVQGDHTQILALLELYLEAVRRPVVRAALGEMVLTNAEAITAVHRAAGVAATVKEAGLLDAYLLGLAMSLVALPGTALERMQLTDPHALGLELFHAVAATVAQKDQLH